MLSFKKWSHTLMVFLLLKKISRHPLSLKESPQGADPHYALCTQLQHQHLLKKTMYIQNVHEISSPVVFTFYLTTLGYHYLYVYQTAKHSIRKNNRFVIAYRNRQWLVLVALLIYLVFSEALTWQEINFISWQWSLAIIFLLLLTSLYQGTKEIHWNRNSRYMKKEVCHMMRKYI